MPDINIKADVKKTSTLGKVKVMVEQVVGSPSEIQISEAVDDWLTEHPEATTTVQDGSITTVKLADSAVATAKIVDHSVTMDKTDFYYERSMSENYSWISITYRANAYRIKFIWSDMQTVLAEFPDTLCIVFSKVTSNYWGQGGGNPSLKCTGYSKTIAKTNSTLTVDGVKYAVITITKENFMTAYNNLVGYVDGESVVWVDSEYQVNNTGYSRIPADTDIYMIPDAVTTEMIEANFSSTYLSEDFATAVKRAMESDEGTSEDEETAKNKLSGKVMICLGDSYTVGMGGQLSSIANKYEMVLDNRGIVSSSICGDVNGTKGFSPMWSRANSIVNSYTNGYAIDGTTYTTDDVAIVTFMGGANDGFGVETWIGTGIHETDTNMIYGACNHIFNVLATTFTKAKVICITQPSSYNRTVSSITDDATAQTLGFENLAELQQMDDIQFSNYAMAQKEKAVKDAAWAYGWNTIDMFHDFPTMFNPTNRSAYWQSDKLHLTANGYSLIASALDKKIVELVVHGV